MTSIRCAPRRRWPSFRFLQPRPSPTHTSRRPRGGGARSPATDPGHEAAGEGGRTPTRSAGQAPPPTISAYPGRSTIGISSSSGVERITSRPAGGNLPSSGRFTLQDERPQASVTLSVRLRSPQAARAGPGSSRRRGGRPRRGSVALPRSAAKAARDDQYEDVRPAPADAGSSTGIRPPRLLPVPAPVDLGRAPRARVTFSRVTSIRPVVTAQVHQLVRLSRPQGSPLYAAGPGHPSHGRRSCSGLGRTAQQVQPGDVGSVRVCARDRVVEGRPAFRPQRPRSASPVPARDRPRP